MLQGSLDNFALDEVLGLLATTAKTGKLTVKGDRGTGELALHEGQLVAAVASNTANGSAPDDVLFELLRFGDGTFSFSATGSEAGDTALDMSEALASAEARLADWRTIEAVVPSLEHIVTPMIDPPTDEITLDRQEWAALMVVAGGCPVSRVCDELDLGEVEGSRRIKGLVERNLVTIGGPRPGVPPPARSGERPARRPNDPFARRAAQSTSHGGAEAPAPPPPPSSPVPDPGRTPILEDGPERVPATAGSGAGPGGIERRAPVPSKPAPPPPSAGADPAGDGSAAPSGSVATAASATTVADPDHDEEHEKAPKSGGLLMRYLKSDS